MLIDFDRVNDPISICPTKIAEALSTRSGLVVQFSAPEFYDPSNLQELNLLCRRFGDHLEVRFYGHYGTTFDASILRHLPDVANLSLDCLTTIANEHEVAGLTQLKKFSFGVFEFDRPEFLQTLPLSKLRSLTLGENRKRNFNLSALAECASLESLFVDGHWRNIERVAGLHSLNRVGLRGFPKAREVAFLGEVPNLSELTLCFGGRDNFDEFACESLETLHVYRVRGLCTLGSLSRFPRLQSLAVEDQLQIEEIDLTGAKLTRFRACNCKNLGNLLGLCDQSHLREIMIISPVGLDMDELKDFVWPTTTEVVFLASRSKAWNDRAEKELAERGYRKTGSRWTYWGD